MSAEGGFSLGWTLPRRQFNKSNLEGLSPGEQFITKRRGVWPRFFITLVRTNILLYNYIPLAAVLNANTI